MEGASNVNWRPPQGDPAGTMNPEAPPSTEWRSQLQQEARQRIVTKIMDTLKKHLPIPGPDGLNELRKIAVRFEEKIYTAAVSQADYLRRISMKMLTMEQKTHVAGAPNSVSTNSNVANQNSSDTVANVMQSQMRNQGPSMAMPMPNQSQQKQLLNSNLQNNIAPAAVEGSASLQPALPSMTGLTQSPMSGVGQTSNMQAMPGISQNSLNNTAGQSMAPNLYANQQRQLQGRQLQQQQSQNQLAYQQQQQQQQQFMKQKMSHPSLLQTQQKQQSLLQANQLQSSQQSMMQIGSGLQSNQTSLQHPQSSMIQSVPQSALQQNQQNPLQSAQTIYQQSQSVARQQPPSQQSTLQQQASSILQQSSSIPQQSAVLSSQQQQQILGHQSAMSNMQQRQLLGQQNTISDMQQSQHQQQQQRLPGQQNSLLSMQQPQQMLNQQNISMHQQQQLTPQNNISGLQQQLAQQHQQQQSQQHQQHQPQLLGSQSNISNMQTHQHSMILQHPKSSGQQVSQTSPAMLQMQGQPSQPQSSQQQHLAQLQSQPTQLQQQMPMQQQSNSLQREMHQRMQSSGTVLQPQSAIEQQKQPLQPQRVLVEAPSTSVDSTAQTAQSGIDWQEETYQKIKAMKEKYLPELHDMHQKINMKLQQHESLVLPAKQSEQLESLKKFKMLLERTIQLLQMSKNNIQPALKDKLPIYEKQILGLLSSNRGKRVAPPQPQGHQQFQQPGGQNQSMPQQPPSQVVQQPESHLNQVQPMNFQSSITSMQSTAVSTMQSGSMPSTTQLGVPASQQNMVNSLQPGSNLDSSQGNTLNSLQQGSIGSIQQGGLGQLHQTTMNAQQQNNINTLMQSNTNGLQSNVNPIQQNSNVLQHPQIKQEQQQQQQQQQQLMQAQQFKQQFQQRHLHQQLIQQQQMIQQQQKHQILQQQQQPQQLHQQQKQLQQQSSQIQSHQVSQLHQMSEMNDLKMRQVSAMKSGLFQPHMSASQRQAYYQQQLKSGSVFPISSPQNLQAASPLMSQHSSPQVDQQVLSSLPKTGTPLTPPFVVPSPSTPLAPSPLPDHEKQLSGISSLSNAGNVGHQQSLPVQAQAQSLAVGTPGISASPLLAEFSSMEGYQNNTPTIIPSKSSTAERPLERLLKAVVSSSQVVLSSSVSDIGSVVSMIDRIAGSAPGNGSRAAVGEDLVAMTKCRLQARNFMSQDGSATTKKMKRQISAMPLNAVSSAGSANDSFKRSVTLDTSELESTATSSVKRPRIEASHALLEEIRDINQQLIYTVVDISDDDGDASTEGGEGTIVKCTFCAVARSPNLRSQPTSAEASPILPLRLLIPPKYPLCSPVVLDKVPVVLSKDSEDLSAKARSMFNISLRGISQPMSLKEMARTWDMSARKVILEYAEQNGGGSFSSRYGSWENCVRA